MSGRDPYPAPSVVEALAFIVEESQGGVLVKRDGDRFTVIGNVLVCVAPSRTLPGAIGNALRAHIEHAENVAKRGANIVARFDRDTLDAHAEVDW